MTKLTKESRNKIVAIVACGVLVIGGLGACMTSWAHRGPWGLWAAPAPAGETAANTTEVSTRYVDASEVRSLDIDWAAGSVIVRVADDGETDGQVKLVERQTGAIARSQQMQWSASNGLLSVRYGMPRGFFGCMAVNGVRHLEVVIPRSAAGELATVKVNGASGSYDLSGLSCETLRLNVGSGGVKVADVRADVLDLGVASGQVDVAGVFAQSVRADVASGRVSVACEQAMPGSARVSVASGQVDLALPDEGGFTAVVEKVSGSFSCAFDARQDGNTYVYGDGKARLDFSVISGRVALNAR
ncbi:MULTISPECIES: DUF4097 family beta strand repeat-containing protein [unclassified Adlercreutzia]|uniref:DUF4097 family beta strand repeat-containing protein n=1 Tax=unclassified Adlercreutzia TaxID=2636013 RepID=UPI0013EB99CE|nr:MULTISPECIES: DUF4097 family beta strand repeat-containing protein [unclassified Adlercreutzia]